MTTDNVLLHALKVVRLAIDGSLVEHLGSLLEGGSRHETAGLQGCTGDALKYLGRGGRLCVTHLHSAKVSALEQ